MAIVTGDRYLEKLVKFVEQHAGHLLDGSVILKLNPAGLHYVQSRLEALHELENLLAGAPVDYLRAYVSDLGDHRALEQLRRILRLLTDLKVVSVLPTPARDPTPLSLLPFGRLKVLELRGCDLSTSAARGLLELRHTLEKIVCHNSTDALRHVFASRIVEIKQSPQWNRLSFVSCASNSLILMDESLQLLPAVEILDLSRNKFAKVDNLRKCTKLKHLDLGFNNLRTIAPFSEVSCHIVKLVLRNNALTTLHGLENLKSLEGLDVSYNIISNFSELEFLSCLPSLQNLWLEGNPLCCGRWYRAQVFSYFNFPNKLKLDDKEITNREFWKRQIIIASRQKRPSSYGFYSPAKEDAEGEGSTIKKSRKVSRLAAIESEEDSTCFSSDPESPSCDNDIQSKEENVISDDEAEIVDLINRVELMKKEDSILWLREFKEWMDHESDNFTDEGAYGRAMLHHIKEHHPKNKGDEKHDRRSSRYPLNSLHTSGDEIGADFLESDASVVDLSPRRMGRPKQNHEKSYLQGVSVQGDHKIIENGNLSPLTAIDDTTESYSSSAYPVSPPYYQEDLLHRRHNLVEEFLQLSVESYSVASSDSSSSSSEDDLHEYDHLTPDDLSQNERYLNCTVGYSSSDLSNDVKYDQNHGSTHAMENRRFFFGVNNLNSNSNDIPCLSCADEVDHGDDEKTDWLEKTSRRKQKRRVVSLSEDGVDKTVTSGRPNINGDACQADEIIDTKQLNKNASKAPAPTISNVGRFSDDFVEKFFNANVADSRMSETCRHYMCCDCILEPDSLYREREVVLLLSSANKLYVLLIGVAFDGSGNILSLLGWHRAEDVKEVLVGIGLLVVRVYIERATYLFLTRSIEKSRQLLYILQIFGPSAINDKCILRSLEQVQVDLFKKQICGGSKVSIFQYAMVLSWNRHEDGLWLSRSLFVIGDHVLLCIEDLKKFSTRSIVGSSSPYFSLDSCCCISDITKLVVESGESQHITLYLEHASTIEFSSSSKAQKEVATTDTGNSGPSSLTWKLKWFSKESLCNFVALLKAIHASITMSTELIIEHAL
ncbi:Outer arm dynein light chain 1 protein [Euphorbia peplus]|nr:Outer arm dynein light chain 1 protein [Euphorbia peplus]